MGPELRERFLRLGPVVPIERVLSGSPVAFILTPGSNRAERRTVTAAIALARRGATLLRAKRALEEMLEKGRGYLLVPTVEDLAALTRELEEAGIVATPTELPAVQQD